MKNIKKILYVTAFGIVFIVSMGQNRNLPIRKRIKISSKQSLGIIGLGLGLRFGKFNGKTVVEEDFKTGTVSTTSSTRDCTQSLTRQESESNSSYSTDELEALGVFERHHKADEAEVRLVVGITMIKIIVSY